MAGEPTVAELSYVGSAAFWDRLRIRKNTTPMATRAAPPTPTPTPTPMAVVFVVPLLSSCSLVDSPVGVSAAVIPDVADVDWKPAAAENEPVVVGSSVTEPVVETARVSWLETATVEGMGADTPANATMLVAVLSGLGVATANFMFAKSKTA